VQAGPRVDAGAGIRPRLGDRTVVLTTLMLLIVGIGFDTWGPDWAQHVTSVATWATFVGLVALERGRARAELLICMLIAGGGEYVFGNVIGLWEYRLGNLPLYIPPGHALVFASGLRMARHAPKWLPVFVPAVLAPYAAWGVITGIDQAAIFLWGLLVACILFGRDKRLYAAMFPFAMAIEVWGTTIGGWSYAASWFGAATTNPPAGAPALYCLLDVLVLGAVALGTRFARKPSTPTSARIPKSDAHPASNQGPVATD
jgi:hypothetical protein